MDSGRSISVSEVEALLHRCNGSGRSLFVHLNELISKLISENPKDPYDDFEFFSESVKRLHDDVPSEPSPPLGSCKILSSYIHSLKKLNQLVAPLPADNPTPLQLPNMQNFSQQNRLLNLAGTGFSEAEAFRISCALKALAMSQPSLDSVRFWGKILGLEADYIIAETSLFGAEGQSEDQPDEKEEMDPRGKGANKHVYWVLTADGFTWAMLPDVQPHHISLSRKIKKLFTGNLNQPVISFPWFKGCERHLLRAVIARIVSETTLSPAGHFVVNEEDPGVLEEDPEFEFPPLHQLTNLENWVHSSPYITAAGLTSYPELDEQDEEYPQVQTLMETDPILEPLRPISEDPTPFPTDGRPAWKVQMAGDAAVYGEGTCFGCVHIASTQWPGAFTVCELKAHTSVYIGFGITANTEMHTSVPAAPAEVCVDPVDIEEQPEPQPGDEELSDGASHDDPEERESKSEEVDEDEEEEEEED